MKQNKLAPVWENFKATGRFLSEWRDTLLYSGVGILAVANGFMETPLLTPKETIDAALTVGYAREAVRAWSWSTTKRMKVAGDSLYEERPLEQCQDTASAVHFLFLAAFMEVCAPALKAYLDPAAKISLIDPRLLSAVSMVLTGAFLNVMRAGGAKEVIDTFDYIWDWPRKRDGGNSETQKLIKGGRAFMAKRGMISNPTSQPA